MERDIQTKAIVLSVYKYGELHKKVFAISPDLGLFEAIIFGGRKGKKTAIASLFSISNMQLYYNPVKKQYSIVEAQTTFDAEKIKEDLALTYNASFFCELVMRCASYESSLVFDLLKDALLALENLSELRKRITVSFIWSLMHISGNAPNLEICPLCDRVLEEDEILYYSNTINAPCCKACSDNQSLILAPGSRRYLRYTSSISLLDSIEVAINETAEKRIYNYMLKWASLFAQCPLKTLRELEGFN